ncbi:hypothetical protein FRB96_005681 [Tulasnella sp. 330]|nr:hypothetical protein FRB96_005681 [Tulasnella sp. 330]KAG8878259.1 hypothetical protein FRB97_002658 [Tulasnella sp. 331]KAG8883372.1 hypothetical protein FRB98_003144 [Tulasnella sp. 332]
MRPTTSTIAIVGALAATVKAQVYCGVNLTLARLDNTINWNAVPYTDDAFAYMANLSLAQGPDPPANATGIDVHSHMVLPWYAVVEPVIAGEPTPPWSTTAHLEFAAEFGKFILVSRINHTVIASSAPGANVYPGNEAATITTARLINLSLAVLTACRPQRFSFFASMPLPYGTAAVTEATYALNTLGASGVALLTNHEGIYLGNAQVTPLFKYLNSRPEAYTIAYVHPNVPYLREGNGATLVVANPTRYIPGLFEFFYETARMLMDLTMSRTLDTYPKVRLIAAHCGGSFASVLDRMLKSTGDANFETLYKGIYASRVWWDSAGPEYPRQVTGIEAYVPQSQLVLGSDYPFAPTVSYAPAFAGLNSDPNVNVTAIRHDNALTLLGPWLRW